MSAAHADPFADPGSTALPHRTREDASSSTTTDDDDLFPHPSPVLQISRIASLTLGTDSLIHLDESAPWPAHCCHLLPSLSKTTRAIPFHNILWAQGQGSDIEIWYTESAGRRGRKCVVGTLKYDLPDTDSKTASSWITALLDRAYPPGTQARKRVKVLVNPFGGQGHATKIWESQVRPIFAAAQWEVDVEMTSHRGHAIDIARNLNLSRYDVVACASGDGLPHEVFNGLANHPAGGKKALSSVAVVQIPCGSGNAMSLNLNGTDSPSLAALEIVKGKWTELDLVAITQGSKLTWSFLSQAVGIIAESDLGTESLRWMGNFRFTWGVLVRVLGKSIYPAQFSVVLDTEDKSTIMNRYREAVSEHEASTSKGHHLSPPSLSSNDTDLPKLHYGTIQDSLHPDFTTQDHPNLGNFYVGNMCYMSSDTPFFLASLPNDSRLDLVCVPGDISRLTALRMLTEVANGTMMNFSELSYRKVKAYRILPRMDVSKGTRGRLSRWLGGGRRGQAREGLISVDGEKVAFEPFQAEVVGRLGRCLSRSGGVYEVGELGSKGLR
ncbi:related to sphingolipid long chain base kinase [Ramularia collo-cygni]|uniref:Related to sphingolipid long chain base kinase n=1 Tax=Ramularia collo-cygni TaxID=112498 RepID=A0A2D3V5G0_9PEZI|nr:related to sphingolipid long chain base kinase [Ramularia collo-cygni]CZT16719.1 related to sphingolipid long chain base kinase [Ramularia collo-cygni]